MVALRRHGGEVVRVRGMAAKAVYGRKRIVEKRNRSGAAVAEGKRKRRGGPRVRLRDLDLKPPSSN